MALEKDIDKLAEKASEEKFDGDTVRYLRDVVTTQRAMDLLRQNEEQFGPLEDPEVSDLRRDPEKREARIQELRQIIEDAQKELTQLGEQAASPMGQVRKNPDGTVADLHDSDGPEERRAKYEAMSKAELEAEINRRNEDGREDGDKMATTGTKQVLADRLIEDDAWADELGDDE